MCVGSCAAFYSFAAKKAQGVGRKKGGPVCRTALSGLGTSELEAHAKLHAASQVSAAGMQESRAADAARITRRARGPDAVHAAVDAVVLRMVEEVEVLPAEIERPRFREGEALEKAEVKVDPAGTVQGIAAHVAEGQARGSGVRR